MATGDILSLTVLGAGPTDDNGNAQPCNGIVVALLIEGMGRRDPIADPVADFSSLTLTVQDPGYDATGASITRTRTVKGTRALHNTYPPTWASLASSVAARTFCCSGTNNNNLYYAASAGTKGAAAPTHLASPNSPNVVGAAVANGGVAWTALGDGTFPGYVETISGSNVIVYALLDFPIFQGSTVTAASIAANAYRVGGTNSRVAASIASITNSSTLQYEIPQVIPVTIDHFLQQGTTHTLELKCSHTWPMLGAPVAFVRARARNAASTEAGSWSTLSQGISALVGFGNANSPSDRAVSVYTGTIDTTGVSAGDAFDEYEVYPWLGTRVFKSAEDGEGADWRASTLHLLGSVHRNGANLYHAVSVTTGISASSGGPTGTGTGIVDGGITWDFYGSDLLQRNGPNPPARLYFYNDPSSAYRVGHFMVDPAGTAISTDSSKVYSTYAAASAAGATLSNCFPDVRTGWLAAQAYNQLTGGTTHNDVGASTAWLKAGTHTGFAATASSSAIPKGSVWAYVRADPAASPGTVIFALNATTGAKTPVRRVWVSGLSLTMTTGQAAYIDCQADTSNTVGQCVSEAVVEGLSVTAATSSNRVITRSGNTWYRNLNFTTAIGIAATNRGNTVDVMGCKSVANVTTTGFSVATSSHFLGNDFVGYNVLSVTGLNANQRYKYYIIEDNYVGGGNSGQGMINANGGNNSITGTSINPYLGCSICGNVTEPFGAAAGRALRCFADGTSGDMQNVVVAYNTITGQRANFGYNDAGNAPLQRQYYVQNNIFATTNVVSDGTSHAGITPKGGGRFQNLWVAARVGWANNIAFQGSNSTLGSYSGYWYRAGTNSNEGAFPTDSTSRSQWVNAQYVDDSGNAGAGLGGGDYHPATGSLARSLTVPWARRFDIEGTLRISSGTGVAGAFEIPAAFLTFTGGDIGVAGTWGLAGGKTLTFTGGAIGAVGTWSLAPTLNINLTGGAIAAPASWGLAAAKSLVLAAGAIGAGGTWQLAAPTAVEPGSDLAPITLAQAKVYLRVDSDEDDALISDLITTAASRIESITGIACRARDVVARFANFTPRLPLRRAPVNAVHEIDYIDADGALQTLPLDQVRLQEFAGAPVLRAAAGVTLPATDGSDGAVVVSFNAGYLSNADADAAIRTAARLLVAHWYDNRSGELDTPKQVIELLRPLRLADI